MSESSIQIDVYVQIPPEAFEPQVGESAEDVRQILVDAILDEQAVRMAYRKVEGEPPQVRTVSPKNIVPTADGSEKIVGHDHDREEPRFFRLDRIEAVVSAPDVEPYRI